MPSYMDPGTYNLKDLDTGALVGKLHVEDAATDIAGGRGYVIHYALVKTAMTGWGVYNRPTQNNDKQVQYDGTGESLAQFLAWVNDPARRPNLRYVKQGVREQDNIPG